MRERNNIIPPDKIKAVLITRTAIKTLKPENLVEKIIAFQFKDAREQTRRVSEVEISGFGKFIKSEIKAKKKTKMLVNARKKIEKQIETGLSPEKKIVLDNKLKSIEDSIKLLKPISDESGLDRTCRGTEESNNA